MDYFAGLDISMDETHVCVLDREGMSRQCPLFAHCGHWRSRRSTPAVAERVSIGVASGKTGVRAIAAIRSDWRIS